MCSKLSCTDCPKCLVPTHGQVTEKKAPKADLTCERGQQTEVRVGGNQKSQREKTEAGPTKTRYFIALRSWQHLWPPRSLAMSCGLIAHVGPQYNQGP